MSLLNRLQRLTGDGAARKGKEPGGDRSETSARADEISALRERIETVLARRPEGLRRTEAAGRGRVPLEDLVPGKETANEAGAFFCASCLAGGAMRHGRFCVRDLAPLNMGLIALLANDPLLQDFDYRDALFFDTETTGLAGGTGTVAFLIGLGWFEGDGFVTRQLFARDYAEERSTLQELISLLRERRFLVSFNGKAFDANLLASRFIMNRLHNPLAALPHLDLLHCSRRLLSHRLADRRLGSLEAAVLGFEREGDIPGSEIPQRYFDWLRRRDGRLMADVFEHNRLDILSLAALAAHLTELIDPEREDSARHPGDRLAAARLFLARNRHDEAVHLLDPLCRCSAPETAREAARELSLHHKRSGRWTDAAAAWEEMLRQDPGDLFALVELAKWHEHRQRDLGQALALTQRACACPGPLSSDEREGFQRRRQRLERKLAAAGAGREIRGDSRPVGTSK